eukprot:scaffold132441_cov71-Attheya_sp.AAC.2
MWSLEVPSMRFRPCSHHRASSRSPCHFQRVSPKSDVLPRQRHDLRYVIRKSKLYYWLFYVPVGAKVSSGTVYR